MKPLTEIKSRINGAPEKMLITMHQNPDADAIGSSLALKDYLVRKGHEVSVVSPNEFPDFLKWMPGHEEVLIFEKQKERVLKALKEAELLFCLDFNSFGRTRNFAPFIEKANLTKVLIDHHLHPQEEDFDFGRSDPSAASTTLMIYEMVVALGDADQVNLNMAKCIYAGTMTDTGSFRFPSTSSRVHRMVADLMDLGLDHEEIHRCIYDNYGENRLRFLGKALLDQMEVFYEYNTALITIPRDLYKKYDLKTGDTEGLVNIPLSIKGIRFSALLKDRNGEIRISFRSTGDFDVNLFAKKYFEGGGHKNAAGGRSKESLEKTVKRFKTAIKENKNLFNN